MFNSSSIKTAVFLLIMWLTPMLGYSQIYGSPFIERYNAKDYNASVSNFDIERDTLGRLYFGNWSGVLRFDGNQWKKIVIANGRSAYDLALGDDGKVYVTTSEGFGYLTTDNLGNDVFHLIDVEQYDIEPNEVSGIFPAGKYIYIITDKNLLRYSSDEGLHKSAILGETKYTGKFHLRGENVFAYEDELYIIRNDKGLFKLVNDQLEPVEGGNKVAGKVIVASGKTPEGQLLISEKGESFLLADSLMERDFLSADLKAELVAQGIRSLDIQETGNTYALAIGTSKNGLYYVRDGKLAFHVNQFNGLSNNEIRAVKFVGNSLWVTTQSGISSLTGLEQFAIWNTENKDIGLIWELYKKDGVLYVATTKGLYTLQNNSLVKMTSSSARSYFLYDFQDQLLLNTEYGINRVSGNIIEPLYTLEIANKAAIYRDDIFMMSMKGLYRAPFEGNSLEKPIPVTKMVSGHSFSADTYADALWFSVVNSGVIKIWKEQGEYKVIRYTAKHGLPEDTSVEFVKVDDQMLIASNDGFYRINPQPAPDSSNLFIRDSNLIKERIDVSYPAKDNLGNIWYVVSSEEHPDRLEKLERNSDGSYDRVKLPFRLLTDQELTVVYPDPELENVVWVAGTAGLYRYNGNISTEGQNNANILINRISLGDSIIFNGAYSAAISPKPPKFESDNNNISFQFAATTYEVPSLTQFSYLLEGFDGSWSAWSTDNKKEYTNLNPGTYTFKVKARDVYSNETGVASYSFEIDEPWYLEFWAILIFILLAALLVRFIIYVYTHRLTVQQKKLEHAVSMKTAEIQKQKREIEIKNNSLKRRSEELSIHRDEILDKNNELEQQRDELKKLNATKDKFFSIIGHDLKGPVNSLISFSHLLSNHVDDMSNDEIRSLAHDLDKSLKNTSNLLDNLLEWSRSQTNQVKYNFEPCDLKSLIKGNIDLFASQAKNKNIALENGVDSTLVWADKNCINTVLRNLLSNAIKFTKEGGRVNISVAEMNEKVVVSVADTGVGMGKESVQSIFSLEKKHATLGTSKEKGTGLGLILCKEFVQKNGGEIWVGSEEGKGTVFSFSLPKHKG